MPKESKLSEFIAHPNKSLWKLAIPMTLGLFVNSIYILVDTYFIGAMPEIGTSAISALGYVMPFYFVIMGITFGLASGTTAVIAQYIGKGNKNKANETAHNSLLIATIMSIINFLFIYFLGKEALMLQGLESESEVLNLATQYFYVMAYGSIFMIFGIFLRSILIGEGESMLPMAALGIGTILNIVLDPFFIDWWGIAGAAYATVTSQIIVLLIFLYYFIIKKSTYINLIFKKIDFNFIIWKKIFNIGFPSSISMLIMSFGLFFMNSILANGMPNGDAHIAGYNLANRIENFITLTLISISTSQVTIIGMFYGARRFDLIKPLVRYTTFWAMVIAALFSFVTFFFIDDIAPLFFNINSNDSVNAALALKSTISYYKIMLIAFPFIALTMVSTRSIQAIGQAWPMTLVTIMRVLIIQCGLSYFFIVYLEKTQIEWVWYAISISCILAGIIAYLIRLYFLRDKYLNFEN